MLLGTSACSPCWVTVILPLTLVMAQDITMTPPNSDGWVSPDSFFTSSQPVKVKSEGLGSSSKHGIVAANKDSSDKPAMPQETCSMKCSGEADGTRPYLQRFVRLLLDASNLDGNEIQSLNNAELKFSLSGDHLKILQQFAKDGNVKSLRKVDEIFAAMLVQPHSYFPNLPKFPSFGSILQFLQHFRIGSFYISIFLPAVCFTIALFITGNVFKSFLWLTPAAFVSSFITTAQRLYEEEEIKQYQLMQKYSDIPEDCLNSGKTWKLLSFFSSSNDQCLVYLKVHNIDPRLGITTMKVLSKMFGESLSDLMEYFGTGTYKYFCAFEEMNFFYKCLVFPSAGLLLYLFLALLLLWWSGGSIRLPYFLGSLNFNKSHQNAVSSEHSPTNVPPVFSRLESAPSTSNITLNFHQAVPANVQEIIRSFSQSQTPSLHAVSSANSNEIFSQQQLCESTIVQDRLAGGDTFSSTMDIEPSRWSGSTNKKISKASVNVGHKKVPKHLTQLQAKYKSGGKSSCKTTMRRRHLSL